MDKEMEEMEMPCMCICGNWFDLNEGYHQKGSNDVVCENCYEEEEEEEEENSS